MYKICKKAESAARQREIEAHFLLMLSHVPYERITLCDLCQAMNLPRKTVYRYFPTKQDILLALIDHRLTDCNRAVFPEPERKDLLNYASLERYFAFWLEQKPFLDAIVGNNLHNLLLTRIDMIVDITKQALPSPAGFAQNQTDFFVSHGLMITALRWHHFGYPCTPAEMAAGLGPMLCAPDASISRLYF